MSPLSGSFFVCCAAHLARPFNMETYSFQLWDIFLNYFFNYFFPSFCSALSHENPNSDTEPHKPAPSVFFSSPTFSCSFAPLSCRFTQFYFLFGFPDFNNIVLVSDALCCSLNISLTDTYLFYKDAKLCLSLRLFMIGFFSFYVFFFQHRVLSKLLFCLFWAGAFSVTCFPNCPVIPVVYVLRFKRTQ